MVPETVFSQNRDHQVVIMNPKVGDKVLVSNTDSTLEEYHQQWLDTSKSNANEDGDSESSLPGKWKFYQEKANDEQYKLGFRVAITLQKPVKNIAWHPKGDYFSTVLDDKNSSNSVIMHQLSRQKSVRPFAKMNGIVQQAVFHPSKPIIFVAVS